MTICCLAEFGLDCFHFMCICCVAKRQKGENIMENTLKKIGARVYLDEIDMIIQKVTYIYADGTESEPLPRFVHLCIFTDSILFGEECQIRFFVYPNSLKLYDTDVDTLEFFNNSIRSVTISCFGQQMALTPEQTAFIIKK